MRRLSMREEIGEDLAAGERGEGQRADELLGGARS